MHAIDRCAQHGLALGDELLLQFIAGTKSGVGDLHVFSRMLARSDPASVDDPDGATRDRNCDRTITRTGRRTGQDALNGLFHGEELTPYVRIGDGHRTAACHLLEERRHHAAFRAEDVSQPNRTHACRARRHAQPHEFGEALGGP